MGKLIDLRFTEANADLIERGKKRATLRRSVHGEPGDFFYVRGLRYVLDRVTPGQVGVLARGYYPLEGRPSPKAVLDDLEAAYGMLHPVVQTQVWHLHLFRLDGPAEEGAEEDYHAAQARQYEEELARQAELDDRARGEYYGGPRMQGDEGEP